MGRPIFSPGYYAAQSLHLSQSIDQALLEHSFNSSTSTSTTHSHSNNSEEDDDDDDDYPKPLHFPSSTSSSDDEDDCRPPPHPIEERFLDPSSPEAIRMLLPTLTSHLSPLSQRLVLCLNSTILVNTTRFSEDINQTERRLTLNAWDNHGVLVGVCHLRLDEDGNTSFEEQDQDEDEDEFVIMEEDMEEEDSPVAGGTRFTSPLRISSSSVYPILSHPPISPSSSTSTTTNSFVGLPPSPRRTASGARSQLGLGDGWAEAARAYSDSNGLA